MPPDPRPPVMLNGKFLSAAPTGVHRVARELIVEMDRQVGPQDGAWSMLCPKDSHQPLELQAIARRTVGRTTWQVWEQFELPRFSRRAVLVNLCNLAPLSHPRSVTMIHDAQVFLSPESYSRPFRAWYRFALPRIGARAARIVTVSNYSRDRLAHYGVAPAERIAVVHNGVDHFGRCAAEPAVIDRLGLRPSRYVLAAAGAQKHKNLAVLFEAFHAPALAGVTLVVVGGDDAKAFEAAGDRPPAGAVFAGRVSDGELRALYEHAAALAFPSTTEGFGLPPLEAMSLGCPVVAAPCGALPEVCGDAAVYAPAHDPAAWVEALRQVADGEDVRERLGRAGRAQAGRYRWRDSAAKLLDIVREETERPPAARDGAAGRDRSHLAADAGARE